MSYIVLIPDRLLFPLRSLLGAGCKPSTWLPPGQLIEQQNQWYALRLLSRLRIHVLVWFHFWLFLVHWNFWNITGSCTGSWVDKPALLNQELRISQKYDVPEILNICPLADLLFKVIRWWRRCDRKFPWYIICVHRHSGYNLTESAWARHVSDSIPLI